MGLMAATAGAGLVGCAFSSKPVDPSAEDLSVIFGFIDMSDAPSNIKWVSLKAYGAGASSYRAGVEDGMFFHVGVKPGAYQVERFGGDRSLIPVFGQPYEYDWGTRGRNSTAVRIERPGVFFMGAHRYVSQPSGIFEQAKFEMQPMSSPGERDGWQKLLRIMEADPSLSTYRHQIRRIRAKLGAGQ
ncbi:hypothetical protein ASG30_08190 [Ramlibacter sp. Leaf400]|nr:hypothetical protein ASG30_08190 [Ramlibacter sp. Leaf400]